VRPLREQVSDVVTAEGLEVQRIGQRTSQRVDAVDLA
jgi:hypothetical protein